MTFFEFNRKFPAEEAAIDYFYQARYNNTLTCPRCGKRTRLCRTARPKVCICHNCGNTFPPFADTIFRKSRMDIRMRFYAIHLIINDKKGISGCQLQRELGVTCKTARRMLKQIRAATGNRDMQETFEVFAEIGETCAGGKPGKENTKFDEKGNVISSGKPKNKRGGGRKRRR
ncbi:MAG: hypothetical protein Pg6C_06350 [Treponemataceae bacterium]|nr:MAG: hypothetical protein Pg6C_06350 [Treponemataceae bacterium]